MVLGGFASMARLRSWQGILHQNALAFLAKYIIMSAGCPNAGHAIELTSRSEIPTLRFPRYDLLGNGIERTRYVEALPARGRPDPARARRHQTIDRKAPKTRCAPRLRRTRHVGPPALEADAVRESQPFSETEKRVISLLTNAESLRMKRISICIRTPSPRREMSKIS
ncbi:MAG: hypothetical protein CAPSK01_001590 [Candidatus Accumulibacter vicinus]|uniref:Uncharacterized protein n=1 Tax=Candidatus Accumulibacter vicinus TaxID=2954382 RepID=A0A084Y1Z2_9PROT|nr:MAG: hypothetical protein CAPSK01_001590 [Candidatus Accumulibacter vicinus]